ncbi:MupA/Atu3671 family FMN-dependent luciferase-like monooxygenase [Chitinophaga varians]|uniref:MupA/Atu3671 family FMN-dependent luciferase-like monooxygenase n=1 Tax=Chitinophaga varians TaxID=2202339 RepID=UPI00165F4ED1|nr:MupA/Atu3671 family FMN-dependent luciferase-like monooxygenase [Chitinophaga varians]MBC9915651.1 LLM class flavin-dependent oxidoreductase [Chitinophaga varians]
MRPGENNASGIALITGDSKLTTAGLEEKIASIHAHLTKKTVGPQEPVIVCVSGEEQLLASLWVLRQCNITCIPLMPDATKADIALVLATCGARYVIADQSQLHKLQGLEVIPADDSAATEMPDVLAGGVQPMAVPYIFFDQADKDSAIRRCTGEQLQTFFEALDRLLSAQGNDVILLSHEIPFPQFVMELIWASSRGITVVRDNPATPAALARYIYSPDQFEMGFGLFHFGSYVETGEKNKYKLLFDTARFADEHGFCSVWTPERHFNEFGGLFPNPSVLSAALAVATSRVQIRSGSLVAPLHHPARIAEDWSLIDNLSNGRAAISFACGWQCDDFALAPQHYAHRQQYMLEELDIVRRLWRGEKVALKNGLDKEIEVAIFPKPIQKELPIWVTSSGKTETFVDAGKIGANILTHLLWQNTDELIDKIAAYRKSLADNGFDPRAGKVSVMVHTFLGNDNETVKDKVREPLKNYIRTSTQLIQSMIKSNVESSKAKEVVGRYGSLDDEIPAHLMDELMEIAFNRFFDEAALLGTVEKARTTIKKLKGYDVDEIAALIDFGLGGSDILQSLEYLNELRGLYDKKNFSNYPVTILHCSQQTLEQMAGDAAYTRFLEQQRIVLAETTELQQLPSWLLSKTNIVQTSCDANGDMEMHVHLPDSPVSALASVFTASVSNEF